MQQLLRRWRGGPALPLLLRAAPSGAEGCAPATERLLGRALAAEGGAGPQLGGQPHPSPSLCRAQGHLRGWGAPGSGPPRCWLHGLSPAAAQAGGGSGSSSTGAPAGDVGPAAAASSPRLAEQWERQLQRVKTFRQQHGRFPRTAGSKEEPLTDEERELGNWCRWQRQRKKGTASPPLTQEQEAALEAIERWFWDAKEERARTEAEAWERQQQRVAAFYQQHGRLPRHQDSTALPFAEEEVELGWWCQTQRRRRKGQGSWSPLSLAHVEALEALPEWRWEVDPAAEWEARRQEVADFARQHGRLPRKSGAGVPAEERRLGEWCAMQRQRKRGTRMPPLSVEQEAALAATACWDWGRGREQLQQEAFQVPTTWARQLRLVIAFQLRHGRLPGQAAEQQQATLQQRPSAAAEGEADLEAWCEAQRQHVEKLGVCRLKPQQAAALSALPGWRWRGAAPRVSRPAQLAAEWQVRLWQVAAFQRQHGQLPRQRTSNHIERQLGKWCHNQRQRRKGQGTYRELSPAQVAELEGVNGWFWDVEEAGEAVWEQALQRLAAFVRQHGRLPRRKGSTAEPLAEGEWEAATWYYNQTRRLRGARGFAPLSVERVKALTAVVEPVKKGGGRRPASSS